MEHDQKTKGLMFLYDGTSERVLVYKLIPKKAEIYNYKKTQLETISQEIRFWETKTYMRNSMLKDYYTSNSNHPRKTILKSSELCFNNSPHQKIQEPTYEIKPWDFDTYEYIIKNGLPNQEDLLNSYCGQTKPSLYVKVIDDINLGINALIIGQKNHQNNLWLDHAIKTDIINIPETLYNFECFMDGNFYHLQDDQIEEFLSLYEPIDINKPVYSKKLSELEEFARYFLAATDLRNSIENKIENDKKVLKLLKK